MKTKILKKVNQRVKIVENNGTYEVQVRETIGFGTKFGEWHIENSFSSYKKAIKRKEVHIVMVVMRDLGFRGEFVERRIDRKRAKGRIW